jgi:hypothetical protein
MTGAELLSCARDRFADSAELLLREHPDYLEPAFVQPPFSPAPRFRRRDAARREPRRPVTTDHQQR